MLYTRILYASPPNYKDMDLEFLRSLLFVPGNQPGMLKKASQTLPDAFIPDLEDSVAFDDKDEARQVVSDHIDMLIATGKKIIPRVNSMDTGNFEKDIEAVIRPGLFGISVGKISNTSDIGDIALAISRCENRANIPTGTTKIIPWIETASAVINCYQILTSSSRIYGAAFGAEDFTNDMGIERRKDDREIAYARSVVTVAAKAADVLALDTPFFAFRDTEALKLSSEDSRSLGFNGKFAIHPAQIETINECFSPTGKDIAYARQIIEAFEEAAARGRGSTSLNGMVIDVPVVKRAESLIIMAKHMELL